MDMVRGARVVGLEAIKVFCSLLQYSVYVFDTMCFLMLALHVAYQ